MPADAVAHESLDLGGWYAGDAAGFGSLILQKRMRHIVPVTHAAFVRMRWAHPVAAVIEEAAGERSGRAPEPELPGDRIGGAPGLNGFEQIAGEDRLMLAAMHLASIDDLADVEPVLEQMGQRSDAKADAAAPAAIATAIDLGPNALPIELREQSPHGAKLQIAGEDGAHHRRLLRRASALLAAAGIAERHGSADPEALALGGRDLVAHPLADHLALELGKGEQHVEREPAHAGR